TDDNQCANNRAGQQNWSRCGSMHRSTNAPIPTSSKSIPLPANSICSMEPGAELTASDRRSTPSRPPCVPSDLPSILPSFADAQSSCQAPIRNARQSIANNRSSKRTPDQAQPFSFQLVPAAAPLLLKRSAGPSLDQWSPFHAQLWLSSLSGPAVRQGTLPI